MRSPACRLLALLVILTPSAAALPAVAESPATLNLAFARDIITLDPGRLSPFDYDARDVVENLFVGMMVHNPSTNSLEHGLAESWQVSEDGLTWSFRLRDDVNWVRHNPLTGETTALRPVTAEDFVFAIRRACSPLTGSPYFTSIFIVDGCQMAFRTDRRFVTEDLVAERVRVRAVDVRTVEYRLLFAAAYFLSLTAMPEFRPLPQEYVDVPTAWAEVGSIVTNGPFVVAGWVHSHYLTLARNPDWPDSWPGNVERVEIALQADEGAVLEDFRRGRLDRVAASIGSIAPEALQNVLRPSVVLLGFSLERAPMDKRGVRQAFAWSIDRAQLVEQILPGEGMPVTHFTAPGMVAGPPMEGVGSGHDPEAARQAFATAGHQGCQAIPERIELLVDASDQSQAIAQFIVESWQRELGCNPGLFIITPVPFRDVLATARGTYSDEVGYRRQHAWLVSWTADYFDANNWLSDALHCRYGTFRTGAECDETDALIEAAGMQYDSAERARMYAEIEDRLFGRVGTYPIVPLYIATQPVAQQPWLSAGTVGPVRFDRWRIDVGVRGN